MGPPMQLTERQTHMLKLIGACDDTGFPEHTRPQIIESLQAAKLVGRWAPGPNSINVCRLTPEGRAVLEELTLRGY